MVLLIKFMNEPVNRNPKVASSLVEVNENVANYYETKRQKISSLEL